MRKLLINADDLGISLGTNAAIAQAHSEGVVTAASLLVNFAAFDDAVRVARENPSLTLGLHYCLTSGRPVLPASDVSLLVDGRGQFKHSFVGLWRLVASANRFEALAQMAAELKAQWRKTLASGLEIRQLDSHQHVHMLPGLFELVASFARRERLKMRISREPRRLALLLSGGLRSFTTGEMKRALLASLLPREQSLWYGLSRNDACFGITHSGHMTASVLQQIAQRLPDGTTEIIVHPGAPTTAMLDPTLSTDDARFIASPWRQRELAALLDPRVKQAFKLCADSLERRQNPELVAA